MENKHVGMLIIGISLVIIVIILLFNSTLREIVKSSCTGEHALSCPMYDSITQQTFLALAIVGILVIIGIILIFTKPEERVIIRKVPEKIKPKKIDLSDLKVEDKKVFKMIQESGGTIFQADLIEKTGMSKQKVSRIVDRLEGRNLVERKRRGMTNVVVLKNS
ncbi:hypothetical protein COU60_02595 [Candidatus Pacearchaeota archaeon CG10_big_fil_rev_8_21_14_0_10_34_76]|nr:MAG: hypothetical protein COU60_02595 [Candidatus Pacearchaeota archaeon CG10_big_fil_rev_8_21_14_0_10_34_76]